MKQLKKIFNTLAAIAGVIYGTVCIFISGSILIPIFTLILLLRLIGLGIQADRLCARVWKRTTRFTFK